jgi:hypothetical protein
MTDLETITRLRAIDDHAKSLERSARELECWPGNYIFVQTIRIAAAWWRAMAETLAR